MRCAVRALDVRVAAALEAVDEDCRWELIGGIVTECPDDVLEVGRLLLTKEVDRERTLGADILGRLVGLDPGARPAVSGALVDALATETDACAMASIVAALGHVGSPDAVSMIVPLAGNTDPGVRLAVAFAIATLSPQPLSFEARFALIKLSGDAEAEVRDWATFGLGTLSSDDGPDVRAALLARADDPQHTTRAEALFGLAVRRDPRAVPHLLRALESPTVVGLELDAAAETRDPRLLPALWALQRAGLADAVRVRRAIDRCSGQQQRRAMLA
jgi:HEAT repeat protein